MWWAINLILNVTWKIQVNELNMIMPVHRPSSYWHPASPRRLHLSHHDIRFFFSRSLVVGFHLLVLWLLRWLHSFKLVSWGRRWSNIHAYVVCSLVQHRYRPQYDDHLASVPFQPYAFKWDLRFYNITNPYGIRVDIIVSVHLSSTLFSYIGSSPWLT